MNQRPRDIFKKGSKTYYHSARFFPAHIWREVTTLYAFVRIADDMVDAQPQAADDFLAFRHAYEKAWATGVPSGHPVIDDFIELQKRKEFAPQWTIAFLDSMTMDLHKRTYPSLAETLQYIHGSAEVIGWFMARIMDLPQAAMVAAGRLGRAMQYINFIRDIAEDLALGRQYLPTSDSGLPDLRQETALRYPDLFTAFISREIKRYRQWQREAATGYGYIPRRCRIPIVTAAEMYGWTAQRIERDPWLVYRQKIKPGKARIMIAGLKNIFLQYPG